MHGNQIFPYEETKNAIHKRMVHSKKPPGAPWYIPILERGKVSVVWVSFL